MSSPLPCRLAGGVGQDEVFDIRRWTVLDLGWARPLAAPAAWSAVGTLFSGTSCSPASRHAVRDGRRRSLACEGFQCNHTVKRCRLFCKVHSSYAEG